MWFLSPSGWPVHADTDDEQAELLDRGYSTLPDDQVQAAVDAYRAAETSLPSAQLPGWALAVDVAAALATKANASSLPGKLSIADISDPASAGGMALRAAFDTWYAEVTGGTPPASTYALLTESGDTLTTEAGDVLVTA